MSKFGRQAILGECHAVLGALSLSHWRQLYDEDFTYPGHDLCEIAVPQALGVLQGMVPELQVPDTMIRLDRPPARPSVGSRKTRLHMKDPHQVRCGSLNSRQGLDRDTKPSWRLSSPKLRRLQGLNTLQNHSCPRTSPSEATGPET